MGDNIRQVESSRFTDLFLLAKEDGKGPVAQDLKGPKVRNTKRKMEEKRKNGNNN